MHRTRRSLLFTVATTLVVAVPATAAVIGPSIKTPEYTKGTGIPGGNMEVVVNWQAASFLPPAPQDRQDLRISDLDNGATFTTSPGPTAKTFTTFLTDGHRYTISVSACQSLNPCLSLNPANYVESVALTRIDGTPPQGTMTVNGGAAFTNSAAVTLNMTATDPLINGAPDSASGVTGFAVDIDGDGTYPCNLISLNGVPADTTGCGQAFAPTAAITLPPGDGVKTVGVRFGDAARPIVAPCTGQFCGILFSSELKGNASSPVTDTIVLDTQKPTAVVTPGTVTVPQGGAAAFNADSSTDPGATPSGVKGADTVWDFKDGSPTVTGSQVVHTFTKAGTFTGTVVVKDAAGNTSDPRQFVVNVTPAPGGGGTEGTPAGTSGGGGPQVTTTTTRLRPKGLTMTMRRVGATLRVKGALGLPAGATCAGTVSLTVRTTGARTRVVRARLARAGASCAFTARITASSLTRVSARFGGTAALKPINGPARRA